MHQSSLDKMRWFVDNWLDGLRGRPLRILDLGSMDINGSYRQFFDDPQWRYQGADLAAGDNVDILLRDAYRWREVPASSQDVVISGQAFEHMPFFWAGMQQIDRALKPGGLACIIAPSRGYEHRYPVDCWRFYRDGFAALADYCGLELLDSRTQWERQGYESDDSDDWGDSIAVMRKPERRGLKERLVLALRRRLDGIALAANPLPGDD